MSKLKTELEEAVQYLADQARRDVELELLDPYYTMKKAERCRRYSEAMRPIQDAKQE